MKLMVLAKRNQVTQCTAIVNPAISYEATDVTLPAESCTEACAKALLELSSTGENTSSGGQSYNEDEESFEIKEIAELVDNLEVILGQEDLGDSGQSFSNGNARMFIGDEEDEAQYKVSELGREEVISDFNLHTATNACNIVSSEADESNFEGLCNSNGCKYINRLTDPSLEAEHTLMTTTSMNINEGGLSTDEKVLLMDERNGYGTDIGCASEDGFGCDYSVVNGASAFDLQNLPTVQTNETSNLEKRKRFVHLSNNNLYEGNGFVTAKKPSSTSEVSKIKVERKCKLCKSKTQVDETYLSWGVWEFCNEACLFKYQKQIGANCFKCRTEVKHLALGKFSVHFGCNLVQFCGGACLKAYKEEIQACFRCQTDMSNATNSVLSFNKGTLTKLCPRCINETVEKPTGSRSICSMCFQKKPIIIEYEHNNFIKLFCSEECLLTFKIINNIETEMCHSCRKDFDVRILEGNTMFYDDSVRSFCSKTCQNTYLILTRKLFACIWCKAKKYNFDMIKCNFTYGPAILVCSLNCYSLYQISITAFKCKKVNCDYCKNRIQPVYHLTAINGTTCSFCSYQCVKAFKMQHGNWDESENVPIVVSKPKLLNRITESPDGVIKFTPASSLAKTLTGQKQRFVIKTPPLPQQKNMMTMCTVIKRNVGVNTSDTQSERQAPLNIIPLPVPIYVPTPILMYSMPFPVPFPFPLPIPVPVFMPMSHARFMEIVKNFPGVPENPLEADVVMMAKMIPEDNQTSREGDLQNISAKTVNDIVLPQVWDVAKPPTKRVRQYSNTSRKRVCRIVEPVDKSDANMSLKFMRAVREWQNWITKKNEAEREPYQTELLHLAPYELNNQLCMFITEIRKPNGQRYLPDVIYYLCLGIQSYLNINGRVDNLFYDVYYDRFIHCLDEIVKTFSDMYKHSNSIVTRVEEEHLWESGQLGANSPQVLLNTLIFFNTKYYNLKTVDEHLQITFANVMKHWRSIKGKPSQRQVLLRFYPSRNLDKIDLTKIYEQVQNLENPRRCPIKFYEFYLSKCPAGAKTNGNVYYLQPERSCVPDSPVWYSEMRLSNDVIDKTLNRVNLVKEINVALLEHS